MLSVETPWRQHCKTQKPVMLVNYQASLIDHLGYLLAIDKSGEIVT